MDFAPALDLRKARLQWAAPFLACLLLSAGGVTAAEPKTVVHTVVVEGMRYSPSTLEVNAGDTVIWKNKDPYPHTATSTSGGFDSGEIPAERSWKLTAKRRGTFPYICTLHPTMKASLVVK